VTSKHSSKYKQKRQRHVPQRTCVGCRAVQPKREMLRVVCTAQGAVEIDTSGKQAGRGAYLCQKKSCWETALKRRNLNHALKITLDDATLSTLLTFAQNLKVPGPEPLDCDGGEPIYDNR
jgi:predicted RNA-binding protein YlxR (DUF448 family)